MVLTASIFCSLLVANCYERIVIISRTFVVVAICWTEIIQRQSQAKLRQLQKAFANHITKEDVCRKIKAVSEAQNEVLTIVKKETKKMVEESCLLSH